MKIIKEGKLKHPITFECLKCECEFIAEEGEYNTYDSSLKPMFPYDNKYAVANCPCCKNAVVKALD